MHTTHTHTHTPHHTTHTHTHAHHTHTHTPPHTTHAHTTHTHSSGLLWSRDRPVTQPSTSQFATLTKHTTATGGFQIRNPSMSLTKCYPTYKPKLSDGLRVTHNFLSIECRWPFSLYECGHNLKVTTFHYQ